MMTKEEIQKSPWYFCNLGSQDCPRKDTCKRWQYIKDNDPEDYKTCAARLYNICREQNYVMYLKDRDAIKAIEESKKETVPPPPVVAKEEKNHVTEDNKEKKE